MLTKQEIFTKVATHLLTQGTCAYQQSMDAEDEDVDGGCQYRTRDGRSCAVGCLIPDALYNEGLEGAGVQTLAEVPAWNDILTKSGIDLKEEGMIDFLQELQYLHDMSQHYNTATPDPVRVAMRALRDTNPTLAINFRSHYAAELGRFASERGLQMPAAYR